MKVLLINPPYINFEGMKESGGHTLPFNLAYLAAYLREKIDCQIKILDTEALCLNYKQIKKILEEEKPDVAAFTCLSPTVNHVFKICQIIKEGLGPNCATVVGGVHPTVLPQQTLKNPNVDFVVVGEGEITFYELVKTLKERKNDLKNINGLGYKQNGEIIITPARELIPDLDSLPFPARDLFNFKLYRSAPTKKLTSEQCSPLLTSRGCAFDCIHCVSKSVWHRTLRYRSAKNVLAEIEECINKFGIKEFNIIDDNFTLNKKRVFEICDQIIQKNLGIVWLASSRVTSITDELIKKMKAAGCKKISLGLESGSQKILDLMRKQALLESGRKAVEIIAKNGVLVHASFMLGNIGETEDTVKETIKFAKELPLDNASFFITCPVPGSDLYSYAKSQGFISDNTPWEMFAPLTAAPPLPVQKNLSQDELVYWQKRAFKEFYLRPRYILYKIKQLKSLDAFKVLLEGLKILLRIITKKIKK